MAKRNMVLTTLFLALLTCQAHAAIQIGTLDPDLDSDGVPNEFDNAPLIANADQADRDGDVIGDAGDPYPNSPDTDGDALSDNVDVYPSIDSLYSQPFDIGTSYSISEGQPLTLDLGWGTNGPPSDFGDIFVELRFNGSATPNAWWIGNPSLESSITLTSLDLDALGLGVGSHTVEGTATLYDWSITSPTATVEITDATVPEPSSIITLVGLLATFGLFGWWKKRRAA